MTELVMLVWFDFVAIAYTQKNSPPFKALSKLQLHHEIVALVPSPSKPYKSNKTLAP